MSFHVSDGTNDGTNEVLTLRGDQSAEFAGSVSVAGGIEGDLGIGTGSPAATLHVNSPDANFGSRIYSVGSAAQGGVVYVGQDINFGGGISYDGRNGAQGGDNPAIPGTGDRVTFFRRSSGTDHEVMSYPQSGSTVKFVGSIEVSGNASKPGGGSWSNLSDRRVKKDIRDFSDGLDIIGQIRPVAFKYNGKGGNPDDGEEYVGVIAQEVQVCAPYMVETVPTKLNEDGAEETDLLMYDGSALTYILVNAVQEQQTIIDAQDAEIDALYQEQFNTRQQLEAVLERLEQLEADQSE